MYKMVDQEFETNLRKITQITDENGKTVYGLCLIGHEKIRVESDGQTSVKTITPDLSERCAKIINRMVDITAYIGMENGARYIYPRQIIMGDETQRVEIFAGSHFPNLNNKIELSYDALVNAIADAMSTNSDGKKIELVEEQKPLIPTEEVLDFKTIKTNIGKIAKALSQLDEQSEEPHYLNDYKKIVESILGKNKLVKDCDESQVDHLSLILDDLQEYTKTNNIKI